MTRLAIAGALHVPLPGSGDTATRFRALSEIAAADLSVARIAEGHLDAIAILAEARQRPHDGIYGVWAADAPQSKVDAAATAGGWQLTGRKRYCSGARRIDRALVTAQTADGVRLFDVDLRVAGIDPVPDTWQAVGMAATDSVDVMFDGVAVAADAQVGPSGFYLERPGFWHGAVGVAACWYGGALGAARVLRALLAHGATEHQLAHLGAIVAACEGLQTQLDAAAHDIDAHPHDDGRRRALIVRHAVEQGCQEVLRRVGRAGGTSPLVFDRAHARRAADLVVYLRQHHAERDLAALGRAVVEAPAWR